MTGEELDADARAELRTLPKDLASRVARRLVMAGRLAEEDPEAAYKHAREARRLASRVGLVREAAGLAAYRAGEWAEALAELRAARRLSTSDDSYLPVMADCERGLGRPERALDLVKSPEAKRLDPMGRVELRIVESGARRDLGQVEAAVVTLQIPELKDRRLRPWSARLFYAYADALAEAGRKVEASEWFARAAAADRDDETDAAERYAELEGLEILDTEDGEDEDGAAAIADTAAETDADGDSGDGRGVAVVASSDGVAEEAVAPSNEVVEAADTPSEGVAEEADASSEDVPEGAVASSASDVEGAAASSAGDVEGAAASSAGDAEGAAASFDGADEELDASSGDGAEEDAATFGDAAEEDASSDDGAAVADEVTSERSDEQGAPEGRVEIGVLDAPDPTAIAFQPAEAPPSGTAAAKDEVREDEGPGEEAPEHSVVFLEPKTTDDPAGQEQRPPAE
ncbi:hypothetical protein [Spirillospora sp. NPDC047279]|uniref:hypothetical protein n=1 Tax=Spirillospora sp. NPDC047279 TaxID=3155478 RepID=UPI0033C9F8E7